MKKIVIMVMIFLAFSINCFAENNEIVYLNNEIVYLNNEYLSSFNVGDNITSKNDWRYIGSAGTVTTNVQKDDRNTYVSLTSDALKNGALGGSYYLYYISYPVWGQGYIEFDIRMNQGAIKFTSGTESANNDASVYNSAVNMVFDYDTQTINCNNEISSLNRNEWYTVQIDFDVQTSLLDITILNKDKNEVFNNNNLKFATKNMDYITSLNFVAAKSAPFNCDVKNVTYINKNNENKSGGYMSISKDNVMKNTFPNSAAKNKELIENKKHNKRQMEYLNRGTIASKRMNDVYISWRWLGTEDISTSYNIYRDGVKINEYPIAKTTNYIDKDGTLSSKYIVKSVVNNVELEDNLEVGVQAANFLTIPLKQYEGVHYSSDDGMIGDLDGDGEYEIIVRRYPDNILQHNHYPLIEAYKLDGTHMWTMNVGPNDIASVENSVLIYDLNSDGKNEIVMRIGDNFTDGVGYCVGDMDGDGVTNYRDYIYDRFFEKGPEYLAVFNGEDGKLIDKVPFDGAIKRDPTSQWASGYNITHRPWKFQYSPLRIDDGSMAFIIGRGIYAKTGMQCWKLIDDKLEMMWEFDSTNYTGFSGQGNHNLTSGDVDFDGYDEVIYGGMAIDHDGTPLYTTRLGHGDAMHLGDFDINRPGLEVMQVHESSTAYAGTEMRDARTGEVLWGLMAKKDVGRGICDDFDPRFRGGEAYAHDRAFDSNGDLINSKGIPNFAIYWDGDLLREFYDNISVSKYMAYNDEMIPLLKAAECRSNNGTKANCTIQADIFGDWREELVLPKNDDSALVVFTTDCPTPYKLYTLMHDPTYRLAASWQNNQYNQPPHLGFYWGYDVESIPIPQIYTIKDNEKIESPYSDSNQTYIVDGAYENFYRSDEYSTVIENSYPILSSDNSKENTQFSDEEQIMWNEMLMYYDRIYASGGLADYVQLPTTTVYLNNGVRFVCDKEFTLTDLNDVPLEYGVDGVIYDKENQVLSIEDDSMLWFKLTTDEYSRIFNITGSEYKPSNVFLYDTLDLNAMASGSDFIPSKMNVNGWEMIGDSDVKVITNADSTYNPKKRLVVMKNNSDKNSYFYLKRDKLNTKGVVTAEFEIQMRGNGTSEISLGSSLETKSLALKQINNSLYIGSNNEYVLLKDNLTTTTSNGSIYKIVTWMDFGNKKSDILLLQNNNVIAKLYEIPFYDTTENSLVYIYMMTESKSEMGIDDINIQYQNNYTGLYIDSKDTYEGKHVNSVRVNQNIYDEPARKLIFAAYKDGICIYVDFYDISENSQNKQAKLDINKTFTEDVEFKLFLWNDFDSMKPVLVE